MFLRFFILKKLCLAKELCSSPTPTVPGYSIIINVILAFVKHYDIDVMICVDTRHRSSTCRYYTDRIKSYFHNDNTKVFHSPIDPVKNKKGNDHSSVGGQLTILTSRWAGALITHWNDETNLGLLSGLYLSAGDSQLLVMGTYWPNPPPGPSKVNTGTERAGGLWERALKFIRTRKLKQKTP